MLVLLDVQNEALTMVAIATVFLNILATTSPCTETPRKLKNSVMLYYIINERPSNTLHHTLIY